MIARTVRFTLVVQKRRRFWELWWDFITGNG